MKPPTRIQHYPLLIGSACLPAIARRAVCTALCALSLLCAPVLSVDSSRAETRAMQCRPTPPDSLGPFYKSGAPEREGVGSGYRLAGVVRSARTCLPIAAARIEFWMAGPDGDYDDAYRATVIAKKDGGYRFESHYPKDYFGRPPHIHVRVSADGFKTLTTQHYPSPGARKGAFDFVLLPQP